MKTILYLLEEISLESDKNLNTFNWLAANFGLQIKSIRYENNKNLMPYLLKQINNAHGFILPRPGLMKDPIISRAIEEKIKSGSLLFAWFNYTKTDELVFFQDLGLELSSIKATADRDRMSIRSSDQSKFIVVNKASNCFLDEQLFSDVNELELAFAYGFGCFGYAKPILSLPYNEIYLIDDRSDQIVDAAPESNFTVMVSIKKPEWQGQIIVTSPILSLLIKDSYINTLGVKHKCIDAFDNKIFARNLLIMFAHGLSDNRYDWNDLNTFFREIETGVVNISRKILRKKSTDYWSYIPEEIRVRIKEQRKNQNIEGELFFKELNFIDFKKIWETNWDSFSWLFDDKNLSIKENLRFIQKANDSRSLVVHGPKNIDIPFPPQKDVESLLEVRTLVSDLQNKLSHKFGE